MIHKDIWGETYSFYNFSCFNAGIMSCINIQNFYTYLNSLVPSVETLRQLKLWVIIYEPFKYFLETLQHENSHFHEPVLQIKAFILSWWLIKMTPSVRLIWVIPNESFGMTHRISAEKFPDWFYQIFFQFYPRWLFLFPFLTFWEK